MATERPRYSVITAAELPLNCSEIAATAATFSGFATLASSLRIWVRRRRTPRRRAHGAGCWPALTRPAVTSSSCVGRPATPGPSATLLAERGDLRSVVEQPKGTGCAPMAEPPRPGPGGTAPDGLRGRQRQPARSVRPRCDRSRSRPLPAGSRHHPFSRWGAGPADLRWPAPVTRTYCPRSCADDALSLRHGGAPTTVVVTAPPVGCGWSCQSVAEASASRLRVRLGSTGMPGPVVVLKVIFFR